MKRFNVFWAALGLTVGGGLIYFFATDMTFRTGIIVISLIFLGGGLVLVPVLIVNRQWTQGMANMTGRGPNTTYRIDARQPTLPPPGMGYGAPPPVQQLPASQQIVDMYPMPPMPEIPNDDEVSRGREVEV